MNEPRFSSTVSLVIRGTLEVEHQGPCWVVRAVRHAARSAHGSGGVGSSYFEYSSTMSCSWTGAAISRRSGWRSTFAVSESWSACSQAGHLRGELGGVADDVAGRRVRLDRDDVALAHLVAGDVDATAVDRPVTVADQLAGLAARRGEAEADEHVVQP